MLKKKPVYYRKKKYACIDDLAMTIGVSVHTLYCAICTKYYKGEPLTYDAPVNHSMPPVEKKHIPGTPLIPHPCVCMISSNYRG